MSRNQSVYVQYVNNGFETSAVRDVQVEQPDINHVVGTRDALKMTVYDKRPQDTHILYGDGGRGSTYA